MSHKIRKRSGYEYQLDNKYFEALFDLSLKKDRNIEELITEALDQYIGREESSCQPK